jgi:hypothetical protein
MIRPLYCTMCPSYNASLVWNIPCIMRLLYDASLVHCVPCMMLALYAVYLQRCVPRKMCPWQSGMMVSQDDAPLGHVSHTDYLFFSSFVHSVPGIQGHFLRFISILFMLCCMSQFSNWLSLILGEKNYPSWKMGTFCHKTATYATSLRHISLGTHHSKDALS